MLGDFNEDSLAKTDSRIANLMSHYGGGGDYVPQCLVMLETGVCGAGLVFPAWWLCSDCVYVCMWCKDTAKTSTWCNMGLVLIKVSQQTLRMLVSRWKVLSVSTAPTSSLELTLFSLMTLPFLTFSPVVVSSNYTRHHIKVMKKLLSPTHL